MTGAAPLRPSRVAHTIEDGVATLRLANPPLNILDMALMGALLEELATLERHDPLRVLVLRAEGKTFSAGVSVDEHRGDLARPMLALFHRLLGSISSFPCPTVALVAGAALGGGLELALACDLRVVAAEAKLGLPEIQLGVFPPYAALRLPELVSGGMAARLVLTGEPIDGTTAAAVGLADIVRPRADLESALAELTASLRARSASSLRLAKEALRPDPAGRAARLADLETLYLDRLMKTQDAEEGLLSFIEKRSPVWTHHATGGRA